MKIIAFTGMPNSGKTEAVEIAKEKGIHVIRMGDAVWNETKSQGLKLTDKDVGGVATSMREKYGKDIWARRTIDKIKSLKTDFIIVDGVRNVEEINLFRKELSEDFVVVAIATSDEFRQKRALSRGRKDDINNLKEFEERDRRELSWGLGAIIESADVIVSNEGSIDEFRDKIRKILDKI